MPKWDTEIGYPISVGPFLVLFKFFIREISRKKCSFSNNVKCHKSTCFCLLLGSKNSSQKVLIKTCPWEDSNSKFFNSYSLKVFSSSLIMESLKMHSHVPSTRIVTFFPPKTLKIFRKPKTLLKSPRNKKRESFTSTAHWSKFNILIQKLKSELIFI